MPLIQVSMLEGKTQDEKRSLLVGISRAVEQSLGTPPERIRVWITEFAATEYAVGGLVHADAANR